MRSLAGEGIAATRFAFKDKDGRDWTATMLTSTATRQWPVLVEIRALRASEGIVVDVGRGLQLTLIR